MNKKRNGLLAGLFSVMAALFVALALTPAFGATSKLTGSVKVTGLKAGDEVKLCKFIDVDIDESNNLTYKPIEGIGLTVEQLTAPTADVKALIDANAANIIAKSKVETQTVGESATEVTLEDLEIGQYLVVVKPNSKNTDLQVYQLSTVNVSPKIENGKYVANDAAASVVLKREPVTITKTHNDEGKTEATGNYGVGENVPFVISTTAPVYAQNATNKTFKIVDTLSNGLQFNKDTLVVKKGGDTLTENTDYTLTVSGQEFTIDFTDKYVGKFVGAEAVEVTYTATITSSAVVQRDGNTTNNKVKLVVSNNPWSDGTYEPTDETTEKTYGIYFIKTGKQDESNDASPLAGATFKLKKENAEGNFEDYLVDGDVLQMTTQEDGYVHFEKLGIGEYELVETQAPARFQTINSIKVEITEDAANKDFPGTDIEESNYLSEDNHEDAKTGKLPVTGGPGTIALTIAGVCLLAGAGSVALGNKKKENK